MEPALPRTFLDGATLFRAEGPVIGLALRFDRLDNFWYTLLHELAAGPPSNRAILFIDDLEAGATDEVENEADAYASEALIPEEAWRASPAPPAEVTSSSRASCAAASDFPSDSSRGRVRREYNDYRVLSDLVGHHSVRRLFPGSHMGGELIMKSLYVPVLRSHQAERQAVGELQADLREITAPLIEVSRATATKWKTHSAQRGPTKRTPGIGRLLRQGRVVP